MLPYLVAISFWLHLLGIMIWVGTALISPLIAWPATLVLGPGDRSARPDEGHARRWRDCDDCL